jgi:hypothetical protein
MQTNENALWGQGGNKPFSLTEENCNYISRDSERQISQVANNQPCGISGFGQFHTNEPGKAKRKPYLDIDWDEIRALVDNPQQVKKAKARWLIPSIHPSRNFKEQEKNGRYYLLWADIDQNPKQIIEVASIIEDFILGSDYEIYTSKSAAEDNQKCRILIPLKKPLSGSDWISCQEILNDKLQENNISPDRASERAAQLCYLPNRGEFYGSKSKREDKFFDPILKWVDEIKTKQGAIIAQAEELEKRKNEAKSKREALKSSSAANTLPGLIGAFNEAYTIQEILLNAGYEQKGNTFRHPNSESGSFSASVKVGRVHSLSSHDPLYTNGSGVGAHDAFSAFCTLFHGGDRAAALKDAGDNWLFIGGDPWNKVKQREHNCKKVEQSTNDFEEGESTEPFSLKIFSLNGSSQDMESQMLSDTFVLNRIAILGQATAIYAKPNTGKTLLVIWLLIEAINSGEIKGEDIYYINADDNYRGLVEKLKLAEKYGFQMLAPGHNDFESRYFLQYIKLMVEGDNVSGKVIILDTLKKFTNLMDKKTSSEFMRVGRGFVINGGTLILLAHTNKRRDEDKKVIFGGTSDIVDDVDCAYTLDQIEVNGTTKKVLFENIKSRGDVAREAVYSYSIEEGQTYDDLLQSVRVQNNEDMAEARKQRDIDIKLEQNMDAINAITEALKQGITLKTELIEASHKESFMSKRKLTKVLEEHTGDNYLAGHRWTFEKGDKNTKSYHLLMNF